MIPAYSKDYNKIQIKKLKNNHFSPHLHNAVEFVYLLDGTMEVGVGINFFHMEAGDFAIVFPNLIHHAQVFEKYKGNAIHMKVSPQFLLGYEELLTSNRPISPVIKAKDLHQDVTYVIKQLMELEKEESIHGNKTVLQYAYIQVILARTVPFMQLKKRENPKTHDIVYQAVIYIAEHYQEEISLTKMSKDLGISQYTLSRVFSGTFHQNFNQYLNRIRLGYVTEELTNSTKQITDIAFDAGFQSQATFNRVFQEEYHMTPRQYRKDHAY